MALNATAIAAGIAALSITGVTVKGITNIPDSITPRDCPLLMPNPTDWIAGGIGGEVASGATTFGAGALWEFERAYNYLYIHAPAGEGRGLRDHFSDMATELDAIITALTGFNYVFADVDVVQIDNGGFATIVDPAGKQFYGCEITVTLKERINA